MKANIPEKLENINHSLQKLNSIMEQIADTMPNPPAKFTRVAETVLNFVGILAIVNIVDTIIKWFAGG